MSPESDPDLASAGEPDPESAAGTIRIKDIDYSLDELERLVWRLLEAGAHSGREALHLGTLCSIGADGYPTARTMVLREVDASRYLVSTHADLRSPKIDGLSQDPRSTWVFYDPRRQIQVVLKGDTTLHAGDGNPLAQSQWHATSPDHRRAYAAPLPGGTVQPRPSTGLPPPSAGSSRAATDAAFARFGVLVTHVVEMEILHLHHAGHRRARFRYDRRDVTEKDWLTP